MLDTELRPRGLFDPTKSFFDCQGLCFLWLLKESNYRTRAPPPTRVSFVYAFTPLPAIPSPISSGDHHHHISLSNG
ncbi:unnamed protein product [Cuscuta campestris]|uniref:Uncharacterized protein n=1 Tax=Cuscuta campestris TaxID=132261 RepID=A0A484MM70_9ASTE|nr:unnamed protein product [Cuscuta campestris]